LITNVSLGTSIAVGQVARAGRASVVRVDIVAGGASSACGGRATDYTVGHDTAGEALVGDVVVVAFGAGLAGVHLVDNSAVSIICGAIGSEGVLAGGAIQVVVG